MTNVENPSIQKRKFISDDQIIATRILTFHQQIESTVPNKKVKTSDFERITMDVDEVVMTDESITKDNDCVTATTTTTMMKTPAVRIPNHCNGICDADASPTTYVIRCYCDPYRLNAIIPYNSDIY